MTAIFELLKQAVKPDEEGCTVHMTVKVTTSIRHLSDAIRQYGDDEPAFCEELLGMVEEEVADIECTISEYVLH